MSGLAKRNDRLPNASGLDLDLSLPDLKVSHLIFFFFSPSGQFYFFFLYFFFFDNSKIRIRDGPGGSGMVGKSDLYLQNMFLLTEVTDNCLNRRKIKKSACIFIHVPPNAVMPCVNPSVHKDLSYCK